MKYKVQPMIYMTNEYFKSTIRVTLEFTEEIDPEALAFAVGQVKKRYPYFCVRLKKEGEELVLEENDLPLVIVEENRRTCLGGADCNYHLLAFAYDKNLISIDISHHICDGNGVAPLMKTLAYYYIQKRYGDEGLDPAGVRLVTDAIQEDEYLYPYPKEPLPTDYKVTLNEKPMDPFRFDKDFFDDEGVYAYHLQIRQKEVMQKARSKDGSPTSFISVMLFQALNRLFPENEKEIVIMIPHEFRKVLGRPLSHDSLARVLYTKLSPKMKDYPVDILNTMMRGQILLGCDESLDIEAINGQIQLNGFLQTLSLEEKMQTMQGFLKEVMKPCTFGISYTGNIAWGGMEKYIRDVHAYAGEEHAEGPVSMEVFTCGEFFCLCLMQPGKNPAIARELTTCFEENGIRCTLTGENRYRLPDFLL